MPTTRQYSISPQNLARFISLCILDEDLTCDYKQKAKHDTTTQINEIETRINKMVGCRDQDPGSLSSLYTILQDLCEQRAFERGFKAGLAMAMEAMKEIDVR